MGYFMLQIFRIWKAGQWQWKGTKEKNHKMTRKESRRTGCFSKPEKARNGFSPRSFRKIPQFWPVRPIFWRPTARTVRWHIWFVFKPLGLWYYFAAAVGNLYRELHGIVFPHLSEINRLFHRELFLAPLFCFTFLYVCTSASNMRVYIFQPVLNSFIFPASYHRDTKRWSMVVSRQQRDKNEKFQGSHLN